jgi:hypothetical protein
VLGIALLVSAVWLVVLLPRARQLGTNQVIREWHTRRVRDLCRLELALRVAAVRAHAARTGELPGALAGCEEVATIGQLLAWGLDQPLDQAHEIHWLMEENPLTEPWGMTALAGVPDAGGPPGHLDLFGLPLLYRTGASDPDAAGWLVSTDPLPEIVQQFLEARGGLPPEAPAPFAVGSLYLLEQEARIARERDQVAFLSWLCWGGLLGIWVVTLVTLILLRPRPLRGIDRILSLLLIGLSVLIVLVVGGGVTMCYAMVRFTTSRFSPAERLVLLDEAVAAGQVNEDVAATAREFIEGLQGQR